MKKCICGGTPTVRLVRSHLYTFNYWEVKCQNCCRQTSQYSMMMYEAIYIWNKRVTKDQERADLGDKLIFELEHSEYSDGFNGQELRDRALARLLKDVKILIERTP